MIDAISVGVAGSGPPSSVDPVGTVWPSGSSWRLEWWIGADDRWRVPTNEVAVRQQRLDGTPVITTSMRVPSGDAVHRVYGVGDVGHPLVVEVENASAAPFVLALVVRGASRVSQFDTAVAIDTAFGLRTPRAPSRWARTTGSPVLLPVSTGAAQSGPFPASRDRGGRIEAAFLHPVAHRTTLRAMVTATRDAPDIDPRTLPSADAVARGWTSMLDRGMRVDLPGRALATRIDAARAEVLLRGQARAPEPATVAALEDWGFDAEFEVGWRRLGGRDRRRAALRPTPSDWDEVESATDDATLLLAARRMLVDDRPDPSEPIALCRAVPASWRGQPIEVRDAPVVGGRVSYAVRWHGARAALLWEAPEGARLTAPGLDPRWSTTEPRGEALLDVPDAA